MPRFNHTIIMSSARYLDNEQPINPYYTQDAINTARAQAEHDTIRTLLIDAGVNVRVVEAPSTSQDGVYTANWALVRNGKAVLARLPKARKSEEAWAERVLQENGLEVVRVPEDWRFSGQGDALPCGNLLFCGSAYRSDERAQAFAAHALGYERIQLQAVPQLDATGNPVTNLSSGWADSFYYDIDLALSIIRPPQDGQEGLIAYCPEAFTEESRRRLEALGGVEKILVSEHEAKQAFACNLVSTGDTVVMSAQAPHLKAELEHRGLKVVTPEITELSKGGGYIRCTTLSLND
jgi:N-dimethylarginine dimethylaminohydrolase